MQSMRTNYSIAEIKELKLYILFTTLWLSERHKTHITETSALTKPTLG